MLVTTSLLLAAAFLCFVVLVLVLDAVRRTRRRAGDAPLNVDYTVADLQEMLRTGQLTPEEFERARLVVLRNASAREARADRPRGYAFEVIQDPPAVPVVPLAPPAPEVMPPPPPAPPTGNDVAGGGGGGGGGRGTR